MSRREEYNSVSEDPTRFDFIWYMILGGFLGGFIFFIVTSGCEPPYGREIARRAICQANLIALGKGMAMYAEAHDGRLPEKTSQLDVTPSRAFICPSVWDGLSEAAIEDADDESVKHLIDMESDYVFIFRDVPAASLPKEDIEVYELPANHYHRGLNMMNLAGEAEFYYLDESRWRPRIQESHDILNTIRKEKK